MKKKYFLLLIIFGLLASCDKDEFAKLNQDPTKINSADVSFLLTEALYDLEDGTYTEWFYDNAQYMLPWTQTTASAGGNSPDIMNDGAHGDRSWNLYGKVMVYTSEIRDIVDNRYSGKDKVANQRLKAITYPIQIYQALKITDMYGYMAYSEAMKARYSNPPLLKPKYDTQEELFDTWITELDNAISVLTTDQKLDGETIGQTSPGSQDFVYNGDYAKWAKFANSLKLRIAARLLHKNKAKAIQIAQNAASSTAGLITSNADNFYWSPGSEYYHFQNDIWFGVGGKNLIDFLRDNKDPRVRFVFEKNSFNSKVIQAFFNAGKTLPSYIDQYVNYHLDAGSGLNVFDSWKAPGEPWVRYFGAPAAPDAKLNTTIYDNYFKTTNFQVGNKSYAPLSYYNEKNVVSNTDYTYPDAPGTTVNYTTNVPFHTLLFGAAEVNLYLAEFKLLGASLPDAANSYFQTAIRQSVESLDKMAGDNDILYYNSVYDANEVSVKLKAGEIDALLLEPEYLLDGTNDLEKVYVQQYLNFLIVPNELFVTVRRSGIPKLGSTILPREPFLDGGNELAVPRRFTINNPTQDNINYDNILKAITSQGFTAGSSAPLVLQNERLWYDVGAPNWGAGSNY